jgi:hypothetical protein
MDKDYDDDWLPSPFSRLDDFFQLTTNRNQLTNKQRNFFQKIIFSFESIKLYLNNNFNFNRAFLHRLSARLNSNRLNSVKKQEATTLMV